MPAVRCVSASSTWRRQGRRARYFNVETKGRQRMSTIAERARAEAAEAERENPDAEPVEPVEGDDADAEEQHEEEQAQPSTEAQIKAQERALNAESKRHANALAKALGDQWADFAMCPLCQVDGYAIPYQPGEVPPEQRDAVMMVLGEGGPGHGAEHQTKIRCPKCDGWGKLYTGSRDPSFEYDACLLCNGHGTQERSIIEGADAQRERDQFVPVVAPVYDPANVNKDEWGRPIGSEHYGQDPRYNGGVW